MRIIQFVLLIPFFIGCKTETVKTSSKIQDIKDGFYVVTQRDTFLFFIQKRDSTIKVDGNRPIWIKNEKKSIVFPTYYKWGGDYYCSRLLQNMKSFTIEEAEMFSKKKMQLQCYKFTSVDSSSVLTLRQIPLKDGGIWNQKIKIEYNNHPNLDSTIILSNKLRYNFVNKHFKDDPINDTFMIRIPTEIEDDELSDILLFLFVNMDLKPSKNKDGTCLYAFEYSGMKISIVTYFEFIRFNSEVYLPGIKQSEIKQAFISYL
jgi:hypothetical protein